MAVVGFVQLKNCSVAEGWCKRLGKENTGEGYTNHVSNLNFWDVHQVCWTGVRCPILNTPLIFLFYFYFIFFTFVQFAVSNVRLNLVLKAQEQFPVSGSLGHFSLSLCLYFSVFHFCLAGEIRPN